MTFTIAIVGRPNVGKSTLFNRLVGKRLALVDDTPGVTRDRREGDAKLADLTFRVVDTAGLEEAFDDSIAGRMRRQTEAALGDADLVLLLIDARAGVTPLDAHFADWLRSRDRPVLLGANKCEGRAGEPGLLEAFELGLGDPVPISAEHGEGMAELYDAILPYHEQASELAKGRAEDEAEKPLRLAIVGRPNVGKSTLVNRLIGENRLMTGPEAGLTRDSIAVDWICDGRRIRLVDTAGLRRQAKVTSKLEKLSAADAKRAIGMAEIVVLLLDGEAPLEKQDLTIAAHVVEEGRALVIAINKWDAVTDRKQLMRSVHEKLGISLTQARGVGVIAFSALTGKGTDRLLPMVLETYDRWNTRVPTAALNRWLEEILARHPPPLAGGTRIKVRYITQAKARPPTFALFVNRPVDLPNSYRRYLENELRRAFDLEGVPLRLVLRKGKNPYAKR